MIQMLNVKKGIYSKMIKLVVLSTIIAMMIPTVAFANENVGANNTTTTNSASLAAVTLKTYLSAAKQEDIEQMISNSVDTRYTQDAVAEAYKQAFGYKRDQLLSYALTSETQNGDSFEFMTKLSFSDGNTLDVPFEVVQENNSWKVLITPNSLKQNLTVISVPSSSSDIKSSVTVSPNATGMIATWSITDAVVDGGYWYSSATFSPNSEGKNRCTLNLQQRSVYTGDSVQIEYAIVVPHWYGDDVWGNPVLVTGNYWNGNNTGVTIYGDGTNPSGCKLRMLALYGDRFDTFGEVYNY